MLPDELNRYWETVVDTIQDGVMIVDLKGRIVSVNRALMDITGFSREEFLGAQCSIINCTSCQIAREGRSCHWCVMFEKGHLRKQRCAITRKDGATVHVVKNASVLKDASGGVIGAVETMTDVTDLLDMETQIATCRRELLAEDTFHGLIGRSPAMLRVYDMIGNAAQSDAPVVIYGESGTGKELVAQAVHDAGLRAGKPFVKVNCAALNEALLESELFGHVKGAYTGAYRGRTGRFELAADGDIFLDEIGDMPLSTQVKLLRVLEDKVLERMGDSMPVEVRARIISATNRDLPELIENGSFRRDFYYRINVIPIRMPPLRERQEDIPLLADALFRRVRLKHGKNIQGISPAAMDLFMRHSWPGNVREMKSAFEYACIACRGGSIEPGDLPQDISGAAGCSRQAGGLGGGLETLKRERLVAAMREAGENQSEAARLLGVSRTTVWKQIRQFGLK
jgi:PAS domain S-box-containing protein